MSGFGSFWSILACVRSMFRFSGSSRKCRLVRFLLLMVSLLDVISSSKAERSPRKTCGMNSATIVSCFRLSSFYHDFVQASSAAVSSHIGWYLDQSSLCPSVLLACGERYPLRRRLSPTFRAAAPARFREDLAEAVFTDEGTVGTFVGYKTEDYLIIASDHERSGEGEVAGRRRSRFRNSLIAPGDRRWSAIPTGRFQMGRRYQKHRGLEKSRPTTLRSGPSPPPPWPVLSGESPRRIGAERMQKISRPARIWQPRTSAGGIDQFWLTGNLRIDPVQQIDFVDRLPAAACCRSPSASQGSGARYLCPSPNRVDCHYPRQDRPVGLAEIGKPVRSAGWWAWAEKRLARIRCVCA